MTNFKFIGSIVATNQAKFFSQFYSKEVVRSYLLFIVEALVTSVSLSNTR